MANYSLHQPFVRRCITRLLGVIPSTVVAIAVGRDGLSQMLVASQVMLSIVLPFVIFPLVWLCADEKVMTVRNGGPEEDALLEQDDNQEPGPSAPVTPSSDVRRPPSSLSQPPTSPIAQAVTEAPMSSSVTDKLFRLFKSIFYLGRYGSRSRPVVADSTAPKSRSFKSHWSTTAFGYALFSVVTVANAYVLLMLMMGKE
jgi:metal iron transporter